MARPVFQCQRCGQCCQGEGGIVVSSEESRVIAAFLGLSVAEFEAGFTLVRHHRREIKTGPEGNCLFLEGDRCAIHQVKPEVCRAWPFLPGALKEEWGFLSLHQNCPGLDPQADWAAFRAEYEARRNESSKDQD